MYVYEVVAKEAKCWLYAKCFNLDRFAYCLNVTWDHSHLNLFFKWFILLMDTKK
jgi:hypothetical protein